MNDIFSRNLNALKNFNPSLYKKFSKYKPKGKLEYFKSKKGLFTGKIIVGERRISLHSSFDPEKEAERFIRGQEIPSTSNVVFLGVGLGYHIVYFLKQRKNNGFILLVERNPEVFFYMLNTVDISDYLSKGEISILIDEDPNVIFKYIQMKTFDILANGVKIVPHLPSLNVFKNYYEKCAKVVNDAYIWCRINVITQIRKSAVFADNAFRNFMPRLMHPGVKHLKGAFKGKPAIVVATGPSLRKNVNYLRKAKNRFIIIACDSSLKVLDEEGIEPDFVVSIDFTENTVYDFEGIKTSEDTYLIVDNEVCPVVVEKYSGKIFFIDLIEKPVCNWFASITENKGSIEKGLSVSHTAFLFALYLGLNPIVLIGQDLAFSDDETHARGASMGFTIKTTSLSRNFFEVEDIFGGKVKTDKSLLVFLNHYNDLIRRAKGVKVYDATEGGAKIEGAENTTLKKVIYEIKSDFIDVSKVIKSKYFEHKVDKKYSLKDIKIRLIEKKENLEKFLYQVDKYLEFLLVVEKKYKTKDFVYIQKNMSKIEYSQKLLEKYKEELKFLRDCITEAFIMQSKRVDYDKKREEEVYRDIIERNKRFFEIIKSALIKMIKRMNFLLEECIEKERDMVNV